MYMLHHKYLALVQVYVQLSLYLIKLYGQNSLHRIHYHNNLQFLCVYSYEPMYL